MHLKTILAFFLFYSFLSTLPGQNAVENFSMAGIPMQLTYSEGAYDVSISTNRVVQGLEIATIHLRSDQKFSTQEMSIKWAIPSSNIAGYWGTSAFMNKTVRPDWWPSTEKSMLSRAAPVICLYGYDDVNQHTFAVSEALNTVVSSTAIREETGTVHNEIKLFTEKHKAIREYEIQLRLDTRNINFASALKDVNQWWETFELYQPARVPEAAKAPVYSTWYSYHQNLDSESMLRECRKAREMGYTTIIVDDGWQTLDSNRGYAYTGDWLPERIPEMKELVKEIHDLGMKFVLWYAVPFAGEKSQAFHKMKGKFLTYWDGQGAYVLDPRYPEVREFIINTYVKAVEDWDLDGFKLDFLGRFRANDETELTAENGRDYASVNLATDRLMTDLMIALRKIKPDIMVEFRQPYIGPLMRKYGNMLRAADCPNVALVNRVRTTDVRLLAGESAVHSDMLMWHYDEPVQFAALQLINVLYSVPQISVRLEDIPDQHFKMIQFYTDYWVKNRDVLLEGEFFPQNPLLNYPVLVGKNDRKSITTLFEDRLVAVDLSTQPAFDIVNGKTTEKIIIDFSGEKGYYAFRIVDCMGNESATGGMTVKPGVKVFEVPAAGMIQFFKL
ncbi:MAG: alpha-galactosidase [Bacteroidetes bacterium]|nr:MAG: alpha-galactosidase [Bacteroidota bacterium]